MTTPGPAEQDRQARKFPVRQKAEQKAAKASYQRIKHYTMHQFLEPKYGNRDELLP
ncbi:hypothetical protein [Novosphingobium sp.]|uniref:hypothetical protein n=1 Tax=Novosphingobium sp. TaxID=1874826 RepID=UPI0031D871B1